MHLYTDEGDIDTTSNHPFYVIGKGWVAAGDLVEGDEVYNLDGTTSTILGSEIEVLDKPVLVYNLEVEDFHSYFVGCVPVLVHNYEYIDNDIIDLPRKGSGETIDFIGPKRDGNNNIIKEFPSAPQSHGFTDIVDNYAGLAEKFEIDNGKLYQLAGSLNGVDGRFEWIVQDGFVTHRRFIPGGSINGKVNKP